jgi:hypothetical protein
MIKKFISRKSVLYKPYLYYRLIWKEKFFISRLSYSQCGEDLYIAKFFKNMKVGKFFVDIGAYHPLKYNNTYLLYKKGWRGINVDLNKTAIDYFNIVRKKDINIHAAISNQRKTTKVYLEGIFSPLNTILNKKINYKERKVDKFELIKTKKFSDVIKRPFDFLNIDIEGMDFKVLKTIDLNFYKPKLICIEILKKKDVAKIKKYLKINNYKFAKSLEPSYFFESKK